MADDEKDWPELEAPEEMSAEEFEAARFALGNCYGHQYNQIPLARLAPALGRTPRQLSRYRTEGVSDGAVAKLLRLFVVHGEVF